MWFLASIQTKDIVHQLLTGKEYTIGRKDSDILITDDQSISRIHANLKVVFSESYVGQQSKLPILHIEDKSRYGTVINGKLIKGASSIVNNGDIIKFGTMQSVFKAVYDPYVVSSSCLDNVSKRNVKSSLVTLGGHLVSEWCKECQMLLMTNLSVTCKVICALVSQKYMVTPSYLKDLVKSIESRTKHPDPDEYLPPLSESQLNPTEVSFKQNPHRLTLFSQRVFIFLTSKQFAKLGMAVELAGGTPILMENNLSAEDENLLLSSNTSVMFADSKEMNLTEVNKACISNVHNLLIKHNKRMILDSEIGYAILYCSTNDYCNPDSKNIANLVQSTKIPSQTLSLPLMDSLITSQQMSQLPQKPKQTEKQQEQQELKSHHPHEQQSHEQHQQKQQQLDGQQKQLQHLLLESHRLKPHHQQLQSDQQQQLQQNQPWQQKQQQQQQSKQEDNHIISSPKAKSLSERSGLLFSELNVKSEPLTPSSVGVKVVNTPPSEQGGSCSNRQETREIPRSTRLEISEKSSANAKSSLNFILDSNVSSENNLHSGNEICKQIKTEKSFKNDSTSHQKAGMDSSDGLHHLSHNPGFLSTVQPINEQKVDRHQLIDGDISLTAWTVTKIQPLIACRVHSTNRLQENFNPSVKNFKRFSKAFHKGADKLPTIIGGSDLQVHTKKLSKEIEDWFHEELREESLQSQNDRKAEELFEWNPSSRNKKKKIF